jgi:discoidin domain receptor family protein 2
MFGGTTPRVFKSVTLTTYCQLDLGIQSFSQMLAYFSIKAQKESSSEGLLNYHPQYLKSVNRRDLIDFQPQNITLDLDDRVGNAVKLELYFENKWLLLSEIQFESQLASELDIISNNYHSEIIDNNSDDEIEDFHEKNLHEEKSSKPSGTINAKEDNDDSKQIILSDTPEQDQDVYKISDNLEVTKGKTYFILEKLRFSDTS